MEKTSTGAVSFYLLLQELKSKNKKYKNSQKLCEFICHKLKLSQSVYENYLEKFKLEYPQNVSDIDILEQTLDLLKEYQRENEKFLPMVKLLATTYLDNPKYIKISEIGQDFGMSAEFVNGYIDFLNLCDDELYITLLREQARRSYSLVDVIDTGTVIIDKLQNGISLTDGRNRSFDLIDYYELTNVKPHYMLYQVRDCVQWFERVTLRRFCNKYVQDDTLNIYDIFNKSKEKIEYDLQKDDKGRFISGTGRVITADEKNSIFYYLLEHDIPVTDGTYYSLVKRVKENTLYIPEKTLTKKIEQVI